ncbi:MAG TPA: methyltransferase domain-containing protein [Egibacteraceae bacterium]
MRPALLDLLACPLSAQPLQLEVLAGDDADVTYGLLSSDAATYPIVAGIPVLRGGDEDAVALLRAGRHEDALVAAAFAAVPPSGSERVAATLADLRPTRAAGRGLRERLAARATARRREALLGDGLDPRRGLRYVYLESPARSPEALNYFSYRFGLPRHFVGLAFAEAAPDGDGPVLDLGCGAGHLTWGLRQRFPDRQIVACDLDLLLLLNAASVVPGLDAVCADATALPFGDVVFDYVFSSDVFSFITRKASAAREAERVLVDGGELHVTSVINARQTHTFAGEPLSPEGWRRLFAGVGAHVLPDALVLDRYLRGEGLPTPAEVSADDLDTARVLSLRGRRGGAVPEGSAPLHEPPHGRGELGVHPLFVLAPPADGRLRYARRFPSAGFAADNADLLRYLPEEFTVSRDDVAAARDGEVTPPLRDLLACGAVLGYPPAYPGERWPGWSGAA